MQSELKTQYITQNNINNFIKIAYPEFCCSVFIKKNSLYEINNEDKLNLLLYLSSSKSTKLLYLLIK